MPERPGLGTHQQPPLPLIQMRQDRPNFAASISPVTAMVLISRQSAGSQEATGYFPASPNCTVIMLGSRTVPAVPHVAMS